MKWHFGVFLAAAAILVAIAPAGPASGEEKDPTIKIVLHPAAAPRPALKYQLLPPFLDRRPGNAAVHYLKVPHDRTALFADNEFWETIVKWLDLPLPELRKEISGDGRKYAWIAASGDRIIEFVERGARCESCDWDLPVREHEFWSIMLPDIQAARGPARILAARARIQIVNGEYDDAIHTLQVGYALGRHVAQGICIVQGLVGCAITNMMSRQAETLIQQPDAPNLYWALATLPRPIVDFRQAFEAEMASVYLSYPDLRDLDKKNLSPEQWQRLLQQTIDRMLRMSVLSGSPESPSKEWLQIQVALLEGYPRAKQFLIAQGHSAAEAEAMPVPQVVLLYTMQTYDELRDELFKWMTLPSYPQASKGMKAADKKLRESVAAGHEIIPIATNLLPAAQPAKLVEARTDRNMVALQILEAIRLYGAAHNGHLPESLSAITEVPIPIDPLRGEPFVYHRHGGTAILESPFPMNDSTLRYEIHLEREGEKP
jgi:hypothetical protein